MINNLTVFLKECSKYSCKTEVIVYEKTITHEIRNQSSGFIEKKSETKKGLKPLKDNDQALLNNLTFINKD